MLTMIGHYKAQILHWALTIHWNAKKAAKKQNWQLARATKA